jgi:hypothetical protein
MEISDDRLKKTLRRIDRVPDNLLSRLDSREVALWVRALPEDPASQTALLTFLGLPCRHRLSE